MPTYEYKCEECGIVFERFQHFSERPLGVCPECRGSVHRVIHPVGVIFKGSGFYVTDNRAENSSLKSKPTPKSGDDGSTSTSSDDASPKAKETSAPSDD